MEVSVLPASVASVNQNSSPALSPEMNGAGGMYGLDDHIYQRLLRERIVFLGSEVRDQNANAICAQLLLLSAEDPEADIFLHINSPGGSVDAGMAIYDTMNYIPNDVATVGITGNPGPVAPERFGWVFGASLVVWGVLKAVMGLRISEEEEYEGTDLTECGLEAYPEFVKSA